MATKSKHIITAEDRTKAAIQSATSGFKTLTSKINLAQTAVATLASGGGFGLLVKASAGYLDTLGKTSDKLGLTTQAIQELNFAVEQTSTLSARQFETTLQRMTRRIGDATDGTGAAVNALDQLNLSAQRLSQLNADQAFMFIAQAISEMDNEMEQLAVTQQLFDSEGVSLINTLRQGADGISDLRDEAQGLGATFSRETSAKAEEFNDSLNKLKTASAGLANQIVTNLLPSLTDTVNNLTNSLIPKVRRAIEVLFGFKRAIQDLTDEDIMFRMTEINVRLTAMINGTESQRSGNAAKIRRLKQELIDLDEEIKKREKAREGGLTIDVVRGSDSNNLAALLEEDEKLLSQFAISNKDLTKQILDELNEEAEKSAERFRQAWQPTLDDFSRGVGEAFGEAIFEQTSFADAFQTAMQGVARSIIESLAQVAAKKLVLFALEKAGILSTAKVSALAGTQVASAWAPAAAMVSLATLGTNAIPATAALGTTTALSAGLALAGNGLQGIAHDGLDFVPKTGTYLLERGERVIKKEDNNARMMGQAVNINFTVNSLDPATAASVISQNRATIVNVIQSAYNENGRTGGPYR